MENLINQIFGKWKIIKFDRTKTRKSSGQLRSRHYWLAECLNCQYCRSMEKHNMQAGSDCQNCRGKSRGHAGFEALYYRYNKNASKLNRSFDLNKEEFKRLTQEKCHYCKVEPLQLMRGGKISSKTNWGNYYYNGIDRIDNDIGYEVQNCVSCCLICNRAKNTMDYNEFLKYINRIRTLNE